MKKLLIAMLMLVLVFSSACTAQQSNQQPASKQNTEKVSLTTSKQVATNTSSFANKNYVKYIDTTDIVRDNAKLSDVNKKYYKKYIDYFAPNGKPIRIAAADKVTDEQMLKAYNILSFYLTDFGDYKKAAIANSMADKGALLVMPNGADGDGNTPDEALMGQPLYQMELPVAGSEWYQKNDYKHRDASYEEIFHMVHDYGIGTTQNSGALPELSQKIKAGMDKALPKEKADWGNKGLWGLGSREWLLELSKEGSLEQEYIVGGIDSYYGLWEAYTESDKGMWGMYVPKNRAAVKEKDNPAYEIITSFLGKNLTYMERIAPEFEGTFKMSLDTAEPYTYKSQYLQNVRLTGDKNSNIEANDFDNILIANKGKNIIDGKAGNDVVQFSGASTEYSITKNGENIVVKDNQGRDGENTLTNIEVLRFTDKDMNTSDVK